MESPIKPSTCKDIILNVRTPTLLRNVPLKWPCLDAQQVSLDTWCTLFDAGRNESGSNGVRFQFGPLTGGSQPQWESGHTSGHMGMAEFLRQYGDGRSARTQWASFSYKNLHEMPAECSRGVDFGALGVEREETTESTFWLGSQGAHTACHYDTYGCNVVVQVYGRKSWLLLPPTSPLTATRIPYEESSVYCSENFFSPSPAQKMQATFASIENTVHHIVLEPGDVLIVPPKWWHFAENLTVSLSINRWLPLESDLDAHMEECIVRASVAEYTRSLSDIELSALINPNELLTIHETTLPDQLDLLEHIAKHLRTAEHRKTWPVPSFRHNYLGEAQTQSLIDEQTAGNVTPVQRLSAAEFRKIMEQNATRYRPAEGDDDGGSDGSDLGRTIRRCANFINATCSPTNVERVKQSILARLADDV